MQKNTGRTHWKKGVSGNPAGTPKGTIHNRTRRLRALFEPHADDIINVLIEKAKAGHDESIRICLDRLIPRIRHEQIVFDVPKNMTPDTILKMAHNCFRQLGAGEITLDDAQALMQVLDSYVKIFQSKDLQTQFDEIKAKMDEKGKA